MCLAGTTRDSFFRHPSPGGCEGLGVQKWYGDPVFLPGAEGPLGRTAGAQLPQGSGQGGSRRHPPTAGEGSGGFHQLQEGKSSKTAASSVPEPPGRPRHLTEKGARVPGKIKIDLGLFSHWPRAGSGITGMNMVPPPRHLQHGTRGQAPFGPVHLVASHPQQWGTRDMQLVALERQLQPARNPATALPSPATAAATPASPLPAPSPAPAQGHSHPVRHGCLRREGTRLGDVPWGHAWGSPLGWWEQAEAF